MLHDSMAERLLCLLERMPRGMPQVVPEGLSRGELFILNHLQARGGTARPGELSEAMRSSTARTSAALGNMERKGWVRREPDAADRRKTLVHLTKEGERYIRTVRRHMLERIRRLLAELGERDAGEYLRLMDRVTEIAARQQDDETGAGEAIKGEFA